MMLDEANGVPAIRDTGGGLPYSRPPLIDRIGALGLGSWDHVGGSRAHGRRGADGHARGPCRDRGTKWGGEVYAAPVHRGLPIDGQGEVSGQERLQLG